MLFRHEMPFGLGAFGPALTQPSAASNGDLTLVGVVANSAGIHLFSEDDIETVPVSLLKNVFKDVVYGKAQNDRANGKRSDQDSARSFLSFSEKYKRS